MEQQFSSTQMLCDDEHNEADEIRINSQQAAPTQSREEAVAAEIRNILWTQGSPDDLSDDAKAYLAEVKAREEYDKIKKVVKKLNMLKLVYVSISVLTAIWLFVQGNRLTNIAGILAVLQLIIFFIRFGIYTKID